MNEINMSENEITQRCARVHRSRRCKNNEIKKPTKRAEPFFLSSHEIRLAYSIYRINRKLAQFSQLFRLSLNKERQREKEENK